MPDPTFSISDLSQWQPEGGVTGATSAAPSPDAAPPAAFLETPVGKVLSGAVSPLTRLPATIRGLVALAASNPDPIAGLVSGVAKGLVAPLQGMPGALREAQAGQFQNAARDAAESVPVLGPMVSDVVDAPDPWTGLGRGIGDAATLAIPEASADAGMTMARAVAAKVLGTTDPAVIDAALNYRVMPGVFKGAPAKVSDALSRADQAAQTAVSASPGATVQSLTGGGPAQRALLDAIAGDAYGAPAGPMAQAANVTGQHIGEAAADPTAQNLLTRAMAIRNSQIGTANGITPAAVVPNAERASAMDFNSRVGSAVPSAAQATADINTLMPVQAQVTRVAPPSARLPIMFPRTARIAAYLGAKAGGPLAQNLADNTLPEAARAALLAQMAARDGN